MTLKINAPVAPQTKLQKKAAEPKVSFVAKVIGGDTYMVMAASAYQPEDEFATAYDTAGSFVKGIIRPPFEPRVLANLPNHNNILSQCIDAMEVNIDGTGFDVVAVDETVEMIEEEKVKLTNFLEEPYPQQSFLGIRRQLRRRQESVGFAFLEVIRFIDGTIAGVRGMDNLTLRYVRLSDEIQVTRIVTRGGKEVEMRVYERERSFAQMNLGSAKLLYYREFGTTRELNRITGEWESKDKPVPPDQRATELLPFVVNSDLNSPYGVPRWINQMPAIVGSRKAEEQNLEYFDAGGMPPAIIFVQGGTLGSNAADQLKQYISGKNKNRQRAVVIEAQSSSGSLDSAGSVKVSVERFGAEKSGDNMFAAYDKNAEEHIRAGFRLPSLFLGRTQDFNYATAVVAYMVAEEQVFQPERAEFDEIINKTIVRDMGLKTVKLRSRPITLKQVADQLSGLTLIKDKVDDEDLVNAVNKIIGTKVEFSQKKVDSAAQLAQAAITKPVGFDANGQPIQAPQPPPKGLPSPLGKPANKPNDKSQTEVPTGKKPTSNVVPLKSRVKLAHDYGIINGLLTTDSPLSEEEVQATKEEVMALTGAEALEFNELVAAYSFNSTSKSLVNLTEACTHHHD